MNSPSKRPTERELGCPQCGKPRRLLKQVNATQWIAKCDGCAAVRDQQINIKFTPEELDKLRRMASARGVTPQAVLRAIIANAFAELERE